jgi:hypothetical protein
MSYLAEACSTHAALQGQQTGVLSTPSIKNGTTFPIVPLLGLITTVLYFTLMYGEAALVSKHHCHEGVREARSFRFRYVLHTIWDSCSNRLVCWFSIEVDYGSDVTHLIRHVFEVCEEW